MTASQPDGLQALTSFTVTADYGRHETTFDIRAPGQREPAARLHKNGPVLNLDRFEVLTGPGLAEPAGQVARNGAWAADGTQVGTVAYQVSKTDKKLNKSWLNPVPAPGLRAKRWQIEQAGLPPITGGPAGLTGRLRFNAVTDAVLNSDVMVGQNPIDYVVPFKFRFDVAGAPGFEISRHAGRSTLHVSVHDSRIDRRLVFACVVYINSLHNPTLSQTAVNLSTNPRKN